MPSIKKYKICKRLGSGIFEKCQTQRFALSEQRVSKKRKRRGRHARSGFGAQLLEKQKARFTYGIRERQFSRYVKESSEFRGISAAEALYRLIESRLDSVVYRMGLAQTRRHARQLVSHGHVTVNGKKVNIPSFRLSVGDRVAVRLLSADKGPFAALKEKDEQPISVPEWLSFDVNKKEGVFKKTPSANIAELPFDLQQVVEFYSR